MGCNVEIELFNHYATEPLEARVIDNYKKIFEQIAELNEVQIELSDKVNSRTFEPFFYHGAVSYESHAFDLSVYWKKDNITGEIIDIYGGIGGENVSTYNPYDATVYEMIYMGQTIDFVNNNIISLTLKANYVVSVYCLDGNGQPDHDSLLSSVTSKVVVSGSVYMNANYGSFTATSAGEGSWGNLEID